MENKNEISTKITLSTAAIVTSMVFATGAVSQEYTFRMANVLSETDVTAFGINKFAEFVDEKSDGNIRIETFHGGQLGSGVETFEAVMNGNLDFAADSFANLATITPAFEVFHFPFLFNSRDQLINAMKSQRVQDRVNDELSPTGLRWFTTFEIGGPRQLGTTEERIETADDLDGLNLRASRSPLEIAAQESWGASGVTVDWPETPEALRLGMVDGLTVPYASFYSARFHEGNLINYILDMNFQNYALVIVANDEQFASLPTAVQNTLTEAAAEATEWHINFVSDYVTQNIQEMKDAGVEVYSLPESEQSEVRQMTIDTVWPEFIGRTGMEQEKVDLIREESGPVGDGDWGYSID